SHHTIATNTEWSFVYRGDLGTPRLRFFINNLGTTATPVDVAWTPVAGTWYHLAVTRDPSFDYTLYIDGVAPAGANQPLAIPDSPDGIRIGSNDAGHNFQGLIDEVEIFDRALSATEIAAIYAADSGGKCKPCGDGVITTGQACDDGNTTPGDGCDA